MKKLLLALLLVAAMYTPAAAVSPAYDYPGWKSSERFSISFIDGYQEIYSAEEPIAFYVEGKSDMMDVEEASGFRVTATLLDIPRSTVKYATVEYDQGKHAWQVKLAAPTDSSKEYEICIHLYCASEESQCANTFGLSTQIEKYLPLKLR